MYSNNMNTPEFKVDNLRKVFRQITTRTKFNEFVNTLKVIASKSTNRNSYIKAVLDMLEADRMINFKIKLLALKKLNTNGIEINRNIQKSENYDILNSYIKFRKDIFKIIYNDRVNHKNNVVYQLEREKMNELIMNIPSFFKKVFELMNKGKLSRLNYRNLYSNIDPFVAMEHNKLRTLYNHIVSHPNKYRHFVRRKRNNQNTNEKTKRRRTN